MINLENLKPFPKFCCSIGYIPTSYKVAMTYEEQLFWFCDFLKNTIIPTVNQNGQAVEELQNLYVELKSYVDNYFDDLDVQTAINNKLDDMAESGQLTDIIAQYLGLAGVLAFDTVTDMKIAENLTNGSIVRTLGYSNIQDTNGSYYKIRNVLNTDVIDDINIIALTNFNNLVAEKIKEKQGAISYKPLYINNDYYFTVSYDLNFKNALYISTDLINWQKVFELSRDILMPDCVNAYDFSCIVDNGYLYIAYDYTNPDFNGWNDLDHNLFRGGNRVGIARTKDFITWEKWNLDIDLQYKQTFAPEFFIDEDNTHYINISLSTTEIKTDANNNTEYYKKNYIIKTDNNFHNIISTTNNLNVNFVNIDGSIFKDNNIYYLSVKDEEAKTIKIYSSQNILSFSNLLSEVKMINKEGYNQGTEGPSIIKYNNYYILFSDVYSWGHKTVIFVSQDLQNWSNWNLLNTPETMIHFTPVKTNNESRNLLEIGYKLFNYPKFTINYSNDGMINEYNTSSDNYPYSLFVPLPNSTYSFFGGGNMVTLTPINLFFNTIMRNNSMKVVNASDPNTRYIKVNIANNQSIFITGRNAQVFGSIWNENEFFPYGTTISPSEFTINPADNITINYQHCYRVGSMIFLNVSFTPTSAIAWYDLLFNNLPAVSDSLLFPIAQRNNTSGPDKWGFITTSGQIQAQRDLSSGENYRFSLAYVTN